MAVAKAIRLTQMDKKILKKIIELDPGVEEDHNSEELRKVFEEFAAAPVDLAMIRRIKFKLDDVEVSEEAQMVSFNVPDETYLAVVNEVKKQLNLQAPKASFLARQCMAARLYRLMDVEAQSTTVSNIDGVELIRKLATLLESDDPASKAKIHRINEIISQED